MYIHDYRSSGGSRLSVDTASVAATLNPFCLQSRDILLVVIISVADFSRAHTPSNGCSRFILGTATTATTSKTTTSWSRLLQLLLFGWSPVAWLSHQTFNIHRTNSPIHTHHTPTRTHTHQMEFIDKTAWWNLSAVYFSSVFFFYSFSVRTCRNRVQRSHRSVPLPSYHLLTCATYGTSYT